jgi:hypothetical protein
MSHADHLPYYPQGDPGDEQPDKCICSRHRVHSQCPIHGRPGQLTLETPVQGHRLEPYDPATSDIPY